mmetsp:Transcript_32894/g.32235  ORF Transcript_32894/g.32235 Transcript_32894/m.32235 type:complete len:150 (-) Transcript_32894:395-844(-)
MKRVASFGLFLNPLFLILGFLTSYFRSIQLGYDESEHYDLLVTKTDAQNKRNEKFAKIIISKIKELKMKGVKIQTIRIKETVKEYVLAHGIFWVDNEVGLKNLSILLTHLSELEEEKPIYFSKMSIKNSNIDVKNPILIREETIKIFCQ